MANLYGQVQAVLSLVSLKLGKFGSVSQMGFVAHEGAQKSSTKIWPQYLNRKINFSQMSIVTSTK